MSPPSELPDQAPALSDAPVRLSEVTPNTLTHAPRLSGSAPSEIHYRLLVPQRDASGRLVTNELARTRKVWVARILFEPVNTNAVDGVTANPCGVLHGETARFRIEIEPAAFPDSSIVWTASPAGAFVRPAGGWVGREIEAVAANVGSDTDATFQAEIAGWDGPTPTANVRVLAAEKTIKLYAWIVCGTNGPVADAATVRAKVAGVNDIYRQVGRRFVLQEPVEVLPTNQAWAVLAPDTNGVWTAFRELIDTHHVTNGVEVYFVESLVGAGGLTLPGGCAVRATANPNSLAHELGHAQGLPDIYAREVAGMPDVSGFASLERNPGDWGTSSSEGYYVSGFLQSEIVLRTLMNGLCSPVKRDLTTGEIHSIWKPVFSNEPYRESVAPVGFFDNAYPNPHSN